MGDIAYPVRSWIYYPFENGKNRIPKKSKLEVYSTFNHM